MKMEQTECSEMSAYKLQTPGYYPKESIQHTLTCYNNKNNNTFLKVIKLTNKNKRKKEKNIKYNEINYKYDYT